MHRLKPTRQQRPLSEENLVATLAHRLQAEQTGETTGHDWFHTERVWKLARLIGNDERQRGLKVKMLVVEVAALLHDVADWKFHDGDEKAGPTVAGQILTELGAEPSLISHVQEIISQVSFKGAGVDTTPTSIEGKIVQDADRLDAIGAIGIARTFAYGATHGRPIYDPGVPPELHQTFADYKTKGTHSFNHFYEKILLLKERMNTESSRALAENRHHFLEQFMAQFLAEWEGKV